MVYLVSFRKARSKEFYGNYRRRGLGNPKSSGFNGHLAVLGWGSCRRCSVTVGWEVSGEPRLSWQGTPRCVIWAGQCVHSHRRGLAVVGFHLTPSPEDSRSELAIAGKPLEVLCEPSGVSCLAPQGLCLGQVLVLKLKREREREFRERGVEMFVALDKAGKSLPVRSVVCALALSAAGLAAGLHS